MSSHTPSVSPAPAAPTASSVSANADALTTARLLSSQGSGYLSTIHTSGLGDIGTVLTSAARLLGGGR